MDKDIYKLFSKEKLTNQEKKQVQDWIEHSSENKQYAKELFHLNFAMDIHKQNSKIDAKEAYRKVMKQPLHIQSKFVKIKKRLHVLERVAAILFIPFLVVSIYLFLNKTSPQQIELKTQPGMLATVDLPDGSKVWLNSNSSIKYPQEFVGREREVTINGEAFFTVHKDKTHPFIVNTTQNLKVEVLGTAFNIDAYKEHPFVSTTLSRGSVQLHCVLNGKEKILKMKPNDKITYCKKDQTYQKEQVQLRPNTAWRNGKIILKDTPLEDALWTLSKKFNVDFEIKNDKLKQYSFTGKFDNQTLEVVLVHFENASNIHFKNEYYNTKNGMKRKIILY